MFVFLEKTTRSLKYFIILGYITEFITSWSCILDNDIAVALPVSSECPTSSDCWLALLIFTTCMHVPHSTVSSPNDATMGVSSSLSFSTPITLKRYIDVSAVIKNNNPSAFCQSSRFIVAISWKFHAMALWISFDTMFAVNDSKKKPQR